MAHGEFLGREVTCDKPLVREGRFRPCHLQSNSTYGDCGCTLASEALLRQVGVAVAGVGQGGAGQSPRSPQQLGQAARETWTWLVPIETPIPSCPPIRGSPCAVAHGTFQGAKTGAAPSSPPANCFNASRGGRPASLPPAAHHLFTGLKPPEQHPAGRHAVGG